MKLLLTSGGLANKSIEKALLELIDKKPPDVSVAFIPTASNVETGDKDWLIDDLIDLRNLDFKAIHIVDIYCRKRICLETIVRILRCFVF